MQAASPFSGVDESYLSLKPVRRRGWGAGKKTIVFGIFKRNGLAYTEPASGCSKPLPLWVIRGKMSLDTVICSDGWRGNDSLVNLGYEKHLRVEHDLDRFADVAN